jgi:hypothetical protein
MRYPTDCEIVVMETPDTERYLAFSSDETAVSRPEKKVEREGSKARRKPGVDRKAKPDSKD